MKSNVQTVLALFEPKRRYLVPLFQRQYVWSQERQWDPLWEDIERKVVERLRWTERLQAAHPDEQAKIKADAPDEHFLGAIVLDLYPTYGNEVHAKLIIDGQQRLMTSQVFLAALRDAASSIGIADYPAEIDRYLSNKGIMAQREVEKYKVWPSQFDQEPFERVIDAGGLDRLAETYPALKRGTAPRLVQAYAFFSDRLNELLARETLSDRLERQPTGYERVKAFFEVLEVDLQIVSIELEGQDDPQIIFETLNARGEPLLPSDLLRNYLFWRASREHAQDVERLYASYWKHFDSDFWKKEERQGRLTRPRVDLFFYNLLQLKTGDEVNVARLYHEYKAWSESEADFEGVADELREIHRYSRELEKLFRPEAATAIGHFARMLQIFDVKTVNSLILYVLADGHLGEEQIKEVVTDLESYLVRRAICGMTTQNYNRLFVSWIPRLAKDGASPEALRRIMLAEQADSGLWPDDARLMQSWLNDPLYPRLYSRGRMEYILRCLEIAIRTNKHEKVTIDSKLTVEHVLPQNWLEHWPLPDGSRGLTREERLLTPNPASERRDQVLQTVGNLTLLTGPLNTANLNLSFETKVRQIEGYSLLVLNGYFKERLNEGGCWDESSIEERARVTFGLAKDIWPHPS